MTDKACEFCHRPLSEADALRVKITTLAVGCVLPTVKRYRLCLSCIKGGALAPEREVN